MHQPPKRKKRAPKRIHRFVSLHWKGFFHLSLLIVALTATFGFLNYFYLREQFNEQLQVRFVTMEQEMRGLLKRSADRLQRLGSVVAMSMDYSRISPASDAELLPKESLSRLTTIRYELDLQSIQLFDDGGRFVWQWPQSESPRLSVSEIAPFVIRVREREAPSALLTCYKECVLRALVPVLSKGQNAGVVGLTQSIADLVLDFRAVTGTDIGIFVLEEGQKNSPQTWPGRNVALTNRETLRPFLTYLATQYTNPDKLGKGVFVQWHKSIYALHQIPLRELIEAPNGRVILVSDVTDAFSRIHRSTMSVLLQAGAIAVIGELMLLLLIRAPTRRLKRLANTLPLLARGRYIDARASLLARHRRINLYDEIDVLDETATTLSHQLESQAEALAIKNRELSDERDFVRGLLNAAHVIIVTQTQNGIIKTINEQGVKLTGSSPAEICGKSFSSLLHYEDSADDVLAWMQQRPGEGDVRFQHETELRCRDGTLRNIVWVHTRLRETHASQIAVLSVGLDVTDRVRAEERLSWLANHDPLTGLFNRHRFQEELERTLAELARTPRIGALIFFDLDHFKDVNDSSGHAAGDALLKMLAKLLKERARRSDVVARLGGDEFAVLLPDTRAEGAVKFAQELNEGLMAAPFHYAGKTYRISASIGIIMIPEHGDQVQDLMASADLAMYAAKQSGRGRFHVFSFEDQAREGVGKRVYWKDVITRALNDKRLLFHFQPVADTVSGAVFYHEALLRLKQEDDTLVLPGAFIDAAQRSGLIQSIDRFVVEEALRVLTKTKAHREGPILSINLSANALTDVQWTEPLKAAVKEGLLNPRQLLFEVTESAAITDITAARKVMDEMTELGFHFAIDDFGAGFASFHYLKHLPIAYVKIDRSFISKLASDPRDRAFVQAITTLAHGYGQKVIAEGVEDASTLRLLRELQVDYVQGYYIGRPGP
ncbi:bifunctional diguanylate cyclase/phosphodiesterase [Methylohalobius crimeensis]|uniref:bifunctional diguanylate cyclase/phosphodiesterase n=1 Tax=Methylohalobius crimeensis TaxID=244365 RepID=UPI00040B7DD7|nr:EAL domain-containing protein [Methylohalobius crimeensis]